jgi:ATP-dependent DNA helicase RecQ
VYDGERHRRIAEARQHEQRAMLDYLDTPDCRLLFLRRQLDDPAAEPCGRCDRCATPAWDSDVDGDAAGAAAERIARPGVEVAPRKQWPSGMAELGVPASGRIAAGELAEPGRVVGRLSDIGWGPRLRAVLDPAPAEDDGFGPDVDPETGEAVSATDVPVPADVLDACVRVLAGWGWAERPVGVVGIGSRTRPHQLDHLARRIADIGRLPLLGTLRPVGERPAAGANSAQRLAAVWSAFAEPDFPLPDGPVLLVDDLIDSGWTMTVAARLLRRAGASAVLPLALAQRG